MQALQSDFSSFCHGAQERTDEEGKTHAFLSYNAALGKRKALSTFEKNNQEQKNLIKAMGDSALGALRMLKRLRIDTDKLGFVPEGEFYHRYDEILEDYPLPKRYDMIRAYLTQKPYSQKKLKLNFQSSTLLAGWDKNKETQNLSALLKRGGLRYLAIMKKDQNKFFENAQLYQNPS